MSLKSRIQDDVKSAMRAHEREQLAALRLVTAAIKQIEVDQRIELNDEQVLAVLDKMVKQRRESLEQYEKAGREDLAEQERFELGLIQGYLPEPLSEAELEDLIQSTVSEVGAESIRDMGKVMNTLRPLVQGRADMKAVSQAVKTQRTRLSKNSLAVSISSRSSNGVFPSSAPAANSRPAARFTMKKHLLSPSVRRSSFTTVSVAGNTAPRLGS
jgi:uncharacterized protein YqeY